LVLAFTLGACAIHPLPEDVTGWDPSGRKNDTYLIVRKIRCEAREAIIRQAVVYLRSQGYAYNEKTVQKLDFRTLRPTDAKIFTYFGGTGIVYSFALDMTETDNFQFNADIIKPLTHGLFTLNPSAGDTLIRENLRAFTITDNFKDLVQKVDDTYCNFGP